MDDTRCPLQEQADLVMAMLDRSSQDPAVRDHPEPHSHSDPHTAGGEGGGSGGGVLRWLAARGGMLEGGGADHGDGSRMGCWRGGPPAATGVLGEGTGEAGLLASEHSWFTAYVVSVPWEVRGREQLSPVCSIVGSRLGGVGVGGGRGGGEGRQDTASERKAREHGQRAVRVPAPRRCYVVPQRARA